MILIHIGKLQHFLDLCGKNFEISNFKIGAREEAAMNVQPYGLSVLLEPETQKTWLSRSSATV